MQIHEIITESEVKKFDFTELHFHDDWDDVKGRPMPVLYVFDKEQGNDVTTRQKSFDDDLKSHYEEIWDWYLGCLMDYGGFDSNVFAIGFDISDKEVQAQLYKDAIKLFQRNMLVAKEDNLLVFTNTRAEPSVTDKEDGYKFKSKAHQKADTKAALRNHI